MSKTSLKTTVEWNQVNWRKLERKVYKLQKRIYRASQRGDVKAVRKLQKTLMKSWSARALAVRRVTQDNQGKKTAGVDGVKSLTPKQRLSLVVNLKLSSKVAPTRRVWIPKPGTEEKRPLGIPTMNDRALQALVKLALEPEWEARFEPNSYGFRPGRSCHDAIEAIFLSIKQKPKYVLDADIAKCFDRIDHETLIRKLNTFPTIRRQIRAWLKAGVMDGKQLFPTSEGTPQGGVISPLLANIALHGMEERIKQYAETMTGRKQANRQNLSVIRYADDFVILHEDITVVQRCKEIISEWLQGMGLELKPSKTRLAHTLNQYEQEKPGFDFLGFTIQQFPVGKYHSKQGFKTIITPSKQKQKVHYDQIASVIKTHKAAPQAALISRLNPIIRGWANYYATVVSKVAYTDIDNLTYQKLRAWAKRRHPKKSGKWVANKYWQSINGNNWVFATRNGKTIIRLLNHADTSIMRHVKVKGESSTYDGNLVYWSSRMGKNPEMPTRVAKLLKVQKGKCAHCGLHFREEDVIEVDHIIPKSKGGRDEYKNLQLLHRHCHDEKTRFDGSLRGTRDKSQVIEEPDEVKVSRPVLKTSQRGDSLA
ncbi:group II intron reverse transcriptase/maturase [Limnoraphis robusta]|uniref:Group II intron reverse transcriptase/maturase n=1 Tax=Limnoraphis robusta CCNP1315 TaxID=3110306 RepID=A0ABU5U167_9CYAN|nr:group II intron reverse transcriptase/maturase [Limnoraphis robusta]MEA5520818.1 group II intron reverse transcriptase/maturase [Limnoraphis robusta CCNP1315]MEA5520819.1 group II intron reverse transcriptase/maturase [Limnoraphis robusta CCNP1315]MEA5544230.1 group II intron reverse transcriptase/maturase [Limnoraphis robusta CCNP1324]